ncbi:O-antigen ligase family protein [Stutzerimonas stutzeri]|uniref:O-antigen ligase family protein n=1 Tax=Stutzerimonas stutzeri TaxID=316 RepID=UPI003D313D8F
MTAFATLHRNPFKITEISARSALLVGILDTSVALSYLLGIPVNLWYAGTLALKIIILLASRFCGRDNLKANLGFFVSMVVLLSISAISGEYTSEAIPKAAGFILHLAITISIINHRNLINYASGISSTGLIISFLYIPYALSGMAEDNFGRYLFFGGSHPNLGSEILAMCVVVGAMHLGIRKFLLLAILAIASITLMQGRAALIASTLVALIKISPHIKAILKNRRTRATAGVLLITALGVTILNLESIIDFIRRILLLDDSYRGVGSGFVGRSDRWESAWLLFLESPTLGVGYGYYDGAKVDTPHNAYLYAIAEFGLTSIALFYLLCVAAYRAAKKNPDLAKPLLPILVLTIFNDRFLNINPYPFLAITILLTLGSKRAEPTNQPKIKTPSTRHQLKTNHSAQR